MYLVIEIQKTGDKLASIVTDHGKLNAAESKYFSVLSAAAVSSVEKHAAVLITEDGACLRGECYEHRAESEGE